MSDKNLQFVFFMHKILLNEKVINYVCILRILQTYEIAGHDKDFSLDRDILREKSGEIQNEI